MLQPLTPALGKREPARSGTPFVRATPALLRRCLRRDKLPAPIRLALPTAAARQPPGPPPLPKPKPAEDSFEYFPQGENPRSRSPELSRACSRLSSTRECRERGRIAPEPFPCPQPPAFSTFLVFVRRSKAHLLDIKSPANSLAKAQHLPT